MGSLRQAPASNMSKLSSQEPARSRDRTSSPSSRWTRPLTTLQAHAPMWRRPRRTTTPPSQAQPVRNARSPTRRCRPRQPDKMILRAPADGVVSVVSAEVGENVHAGEPILMVDAAGKHWFSFNVREDDLNGLSVGETVGVMRNGADGATKSVVTELRPLGVFATWQAERVVGDHDRNTLRL